MKNISLIIFLGCIAVSAAILSVPLSKQNREKRFLDATKDVPETESLTASHETREKRFLFGLFGNDHHHHHDDYDHHHHHDDYHGHSHYDDHHHHDDHHHGHYDDHYNDHGHGHGHYDDHGHGHGHWRAKRHDDKDIPKKEGTYNAGIIHKKSPKN
uniref:Histidine-rich glycoprotein-like n=1 Tax=Panagrolaimus sp. PS1159 TaxID=55785 RepID=A0AC35ER71_9BILA